METTKFQITSEMMTELQTDTIIKEEEDVDQIIPDELPMDIKSEMQVDEDIHNQLDNPFNNVQLEVKQEIPISIEKDGSDVNEEEIIPTINEFDDKDPEHYVTIPKTEFYEEKTEFYDEKSDLYDDKTEIKEESVLGDESIVTYDYPNFDDVTSMDSNDAAALNQVEACLEDSMNIKCEEDEDDVSRLFILIFQIKHHPSCGPMLISSENNKTSKV